MKRIILYAFFFVLANSAWAGINGITSHSRANCINNESITWDATSHHILGTVSQHYSQGTWRHYLTTGWQNTWRSAAVHWKEANPGSGWEVHGFHWTKDRGREELLEATYANDCSVYDGWWG